MKIRAMAGRLDLPDWASMKDFCTYLASRNGESLDDEGYRLLYVTPGRRLSYALNLYVRDQKRYYQTMRTDGRLTIRLASTDNITEFNYAYFRHDTGAFVFTHYRSCATGIAEFGQLLKQRFLDFKTDRLQQEGRKLVGRAKFSRVMSQDTWERHLQRMQRITEYTMTVVSESDQVFRERDLKAKQEIYRFQRVSSKPKVIEGILAKVATLKPSRASVKGIGANDEELTVVLGENAEVFDRFDHDDVVEEIDLKTFHESKLMKLILQYKDEPVLTTRPS